MTLKHNLSTIEEIIIDWEKRFGTFEATQIPKAELVVKWVKAEIRRTKEELEQRMLNKDGWIEIAEVLG